MATRRVANGTPTRRIWAWMPLELADWLEAEADRREVSLTLILCRAVRHYQTVAPPPPPEPTSPDELDEWVANLNASP